MGSQQRFAFFVFFIPMVLCIFVMPALAQDSLLLFEDDFEGEESELNDTNGWVSHFCDDPWYVSNGQAAALSDGNYCPNNDDCCSYGLPEDAAICDPWEPIDDLITNGNIAWTDYTLKAGFQHTDDDTIGLVFRYQDLSNYYLFFMTNDRAPGADGCNQYTDFEPYSALYRIVDGEATTLFESGASYQNDVKGGLQITVSGTAIKIAMDNNADDVYTTIFEENDEGSPLTSGAVGLYAYGSGWQNCDGHCGFTDFKVVSPLDPEGDDDEDGISNQEDNCPTEPNNDQADHDDDEIGDVCEPDTDEDGTIDDFDNCPKVPNPTQNDHDSDGEGDACEPDEDEDGVIDDLDNCPSEYNPDQNDTDQDDIGDVCDPDQEPPTDGSCAEADMCCLDEDGGCSPNGGICFCDDACLIFDDCCFDFEDYCLPGEEGEEGEEGEAGEGGGTGYDCLISQCNAGACPNFEPCDLAIECMADCSDLECAQACAATGPTPAQGLLNELALCGADAGCLQGGEEEGGEISEEEGGEISEEEGGEISEEEGGEISEEEGGEISEEEGGEIFEEEGGEIFEEEGGEISEEGGESIVIEGGEIGEEGNGLTIEASQGDRGCQSTNGHPLGALPLFLLIILLAGGRRTTKLGQ